MTLQDEVDSKLIEAYRLYEEDRLARVNVVLDEICQLLQVPAGSPSPRIIKEVSSLMQELKLEKPSAPSSDAGTPSVASESEELLAARARFLANPFVQRLRDEYAEVEQITALIKQDDGWTKITEHDGLSTFFRQEKDTPTVSIKIHGSVDSDIFNVLALINEVDLVSTFIPRIHAKRVKQVSRYRQLVYSKVDLLWPVEDRDMVMEGHGIDMLEQGHIVVIAKSYFDRAPTTSLSPNAATTPAPSPSPDSSSASPVPPRSSSVSASSRSTPAEAVVVSSSASPSPPPPPVVSDSTLRDIEAKLEQEEAALEQDYTTHKDEVHPEEQLVNLEDEKTAGGLDQARTSPVDGVSLAERLRQHEDRIKSIVDQWQGVEFPKKMDKVTRCDIHLAGAIITPVDTHNTHLSMVCNVDPKLAFVPMSLVNFFSKHLAYHGFQLFRKQTHKLKGSEHEKRIRENRDAYGVLEERLREFFQRKRQEAASAASSEQQSTEAEAGAYQPAVMQESKK